MSILGYISSGLIAPSFAGYLISKGIADHEEKKLIQEIEEKASVFNRKFDDTEVDSNHFVEFLEQTDVGSSIVERVFQTYKTSKEDYKSLSKSIANEAINYVNLKKDEFKYPHVKRPSDFEDYFAELFNMLIDFRESFLSIKDKAMISIIDESINKSKVNVIKTIEEKHKGEREKHIYSLEEIDLQLRKETISPKIGIDFFNIDDEEFLSEFHKRINMDKIFVVGKSKEETIYCILNEIQKMNLDRIVLIVKNADSWVEIENRNIKGAILIPWFYMENIIAIEGNTNIFVYVEDEPCYFKDHLKLKKRTKQTIINSLEAAGLDSQKAYDIVNDTHGLYVPLKIKIFNGAMYQKPIWVKSKSNALLSALLCGKWTECEGDKLVLEELSGMSYYDIMAELSQYMKSEDPFIIEVHGHGGTNFQLASVESAWENLDDNITVKIWDNFIELLYAVLIESEPIFEYPFDKHFEASVYAKKPDWSPSLKHGMLRSLIMKAYYRKDYSCQYQVNNVVKKILETITSVQRWGYISQYFTDLCEAAPDIVLQRLEDELLNPTGMKELFESNDGDFMTSRHYYTNILWAVEQLLLQKEYVVRAIKWLWEVDALNIKYSISNSPKSSLETIYCAWFNVSVLSVEEKIDLAKWAIANYDNAWDVIYSELPNGRSSICSNINHPHYRDVDEVEDLYESDVNKTYIEYITACLSKMDAYPDKWKKIIESMSYYYDDLFDEVAEKLFYEITLMNDEEKIIIKDTLRHEIYRHRYFCSSDWAMNENKIVKFESIMNQIQMDDSIYDYIYLFGPKYDFPLAHPIPYDKEGSNHGNIEQNDLLREVEIEKGIMEFEKRELSIERLLVLCSKKDGSTIGTYIAKYYKSRVFNENILEMMLDFNLRNQIIIDYVWCFVRENDSILSSAIDLVKKSGNKEDLLVSLLSMEMISDEKLPLIEYETEEIKKIFWERSRRVNIKQNQNSYLWATSECKKYGTINTFLELLFDARAFLNPNDVYAEFILIDQIRCEATLNTMTSYYLEEILKLLHKEFMNDGEKCVQIAGVEWLFRNVLDWNNMKCTQVIMKETPLLYAQLISFIFLKEDEDKNSRSSESNTMAKSLYHLYRKALFCPAEKDGKVDYKDLLRWINELKGLLSDQRQIGLFGNLVGRLFAYSPVGDDNCMPCEAVRQIIEEIGDESLKSAYVTAEENKRGVYSPDAGKTELEMSRHYKDNANKIRGRYPKTASIYDLLSDSYKSQSISERKRAEDDW